MSINHYLMLLLNEFNQNKLIHWSRLVMIKCYIRIQFLLLSIILYNYLLYLLQYKILYQNQIHIDKQLHRLLHSNKLLPLNYWIPEYCNFHQQILNHEWYSRQSKDRQLKYLFHLVILYNINQNYYQCRGL
jgi:hypothetical protein